MKQYVGFLLFGHVQRNGENLGKTMQDMELPGPRARGRSVMARGTKKMAHYRQEWRNKNSYAVAILHRHLSRDEEVSR